ncbi:uncharacterized protein BP01DRAFT_73659 [Aspergillus saccharolyticus JOP 1030-1]|uniref:Uncharacterized protein n=1 Tax=Aspergillus saccharolyticus JOP 1030-1 TaxID=1450539 RepID=A0A318ZNT9_9EURO|nr:hypothetical protein BP01DRAFT_73659 [Aspergillus saccharolyticus JOP 1030-1]PYH49206.1 hypothetical protein BP01DRAFT_73659 [Aspergillus saccharolyticus JOP 1030-1]
MCYFLNISFYAIENRNSTSVFLLPFSLVINCLLFPFALLVIDFFGGLRSPTQSSSAVCAFPSSVCSHLPAPSLILT